MRIRRSRPVPASAGEPDLEKDAGLAIMYALIFMIFVLTISMLLLAQVTSEIKQAQFGGKHEQTLNSALAGLNGGLAQLRNADIPATGAGSSALLPCSPGASKATVSGSVNANGSQTWTTDIYYLNVDPSAMTQAQVIQQALPCTTVTLQAPAFAYLVSSGQQGAIPGSGATLGNRTMHATYEFTRSNATVVGGQLSYGTLCWDAGSAPAVGSQVTFQTCQAAGTPSQSWFYRADLSILWTGNPNPLQPLCLDYRSLATSAIVKYVTLQNCLSLGVFGTAYNSITGTYVFPGQMYQEFASNLGWNSVRSDGDQDGSTCVTSYNAGSNTYGSALAGDALAMKGCSGAAYVSPSAAVGAGEANGITTGLPGPTQQLVNLAYFSRCLDVNGSQPSRGLITYPCHQAPDTTKIEGNQQYQFNGLPGILGIGGTAGTITSTRNDRTTTPPNYTQICFDSNGASTVNLVSCVPGKPSQQWTFTGPVIGSYATSYEIVDLNGKCLTAATPSGAVGSITLQACNGGDAQKWNAPPGGAQSLLKSINEQPPQ